MDTMNLLPVGNDGAGSGVSAALGGGVGALLGSWFGGNGLGRVGNGTEAVAVAGATTAIMDGISTLQNGVNSLGMTTVQGQGVTNTTVERAASSTFTGLTAQNTQNLLASVQGFAGLNTQILQSANATQAAVGNADVRALERSYQAQLAAAACCCETNLNIERQGNQTRDLIRDQFATSQAVLICDLKSQAQALEFRNSQLIQTGILNERIHNVEQLINFKLPTPPTPPL